MTTDIPSAIQAYLDSELGPFSGSYKELESDAAFEAESAKIRLSDYTGTSPALITPAMLRWYSQYVQPRRGPALDYIESLFKEVGQNKNANSFFLRRELDKIEASRVIEKREAVADYYKKNETVFLQKKELNAAVNDAEQKYLILKGNAKGREPVLVPWWYFLMLALIGVSEAFINFEAFNSLKFMTPAIATGATLVIALLLALSSHVHGSFLKQWRYFFGAENADEDIWKHWRMFAFGTTGLSIVLGAVWYARAYFLSDAIQAASIIGGTPPNWIGIVGGSLLMNMAVWACGVILSFYVHDDNPKFPLAYMTLQKAKKALRKVSDKISNELNRSFVRINAQKEKEIEELENTDRSFVNSKEYIQARKMFDLLTERDADVLSTLEAYRGLLSKKSQSGGPLIEVPDKVFNSSELSEIDILDVTSYLAMPLRLNYV